MHIFYIFDPLKLFLFVCLNCRKINSMVNKEQIGETVPVISGISVLQF